MSNLQTPDAPVATIDALELARLVRVWREAAKLPTSRAAQILGLSRRTIEGIEQGRGFGRHNGYARLLVLALQAFD